MANIAISELDTTTSRIDSNDLMLLSTYSNDTYTSSKFKASNFVRPICTIDAPDNVYVWNQENTTNGFHIPSRFTTISELKTEAQTQTTDLGDCRYIEDSNKIYWWYHCDTFMTAPRDGWLLIWCYGDNKLRISDNALTFRDSVLQFCLSLQTHNNSPAYDTVTFSNLDYNFQSYNRTLLPISKGTKCRLEFRFNDTNYQTMPYITANYRFFNMI